MPYQRVSFRAFAQAFAVSKNEFLRHSPCLLARKKLAVYRVKRCEFRAKSAFFFGAKHETIQPLGNGGFSQ